MIVDAKDKGTDHRGKYQDCTGSPKASPEQNHSNCRRDYSHPQYIVELRKGQSDYQCLMNQAVEARNYRMENYDTYDESSGSGFFHSGSLQSRKPFTLPHLNYLV